MGTSSDTLEESLCRRHVERILGSVTFGRAEQLRRLLEWLADRTLAADRTVPSEKDIAAAVLDRREFDPQTDSLVRKEMSRLREKLARYYLSEGRKEEIRISTGGGYELTFERHGKASSGCAGSCWLMLPFRSNASMVEESEELLDELLIAFGACGRGELVSSTTATAYRGRTGDVRQFAAECNADFVVEGSIRRKDESYEAVTWLVDGASGRALRSRRITGRSAVDLARSAVAWLLEDAGE